MVRTTSPTGALEPEKLALLVRLLRRQKGWSQEILAGETGRSVRTLQRVERGDGADFDTRRALARAFGFQDIDAFNGDPGAELERLVVGSTMGELLEEVADLRAKVEANQCPHCGAALSRRVEAPTDSHESDWDLVETFECGFEIFAGQIRRPCPCDPLFPEFEDYDIVCEWQERENQWIGMAFGKTDMARKLSIGTVYSKTEEGARRKLEANYFYAAGRMTNAEWWPIQAADT